MACDAPAWILRGSMVSTAIDVVFEVRTADRIDGGYGQFNRAHNLQETDRQRQRTGRRRSKQHLRDAAAVFHGGGVRRQFHALGDLALDKPGLSSSGSSGKHERNNMFLDVGWSQLEIMNVNLGCVDARSYRRAAAGVLLRDSANEFDTVTKARRCGRRSGGDDHGRAVGLNDAKARWVCGIRIPADLLRV